MANFKVTHYHIKIGGHHRGPDQPFSAVFISDMHNRTYGEDNQKLLQEIRALQPELIFMAGDMVTVGDVVQYDAAMGLLDKLTSSYPVYYCNGNHEQRMKNRPERYGDIYEKYSDRIRSLGVRLLENSYEDVRIHRMPMRIRGYELPDKCYRRTRPGEISAEEMRESLGTPDPEIFHVLLAHHPYYGETYDRWGADLTLSGHLHGGIIRLPFIGGLVSPQMKLFPRYDKGLYSLERGKMIVNAGLGTHTIPRINNPTEMVVIDFT